MVLYVENIWFFIARDVQLHSRVNPPMSNYTYIVNILIVNVRCEYICIIF